MVDYRDLVPPELERPTTKEGWMDLFRQVHGDVEDGLVKFLFIAEEEGFEVTVEDVETITEEPSTATFE